MEEIRYRPIGDVRTPIAAPEGVPIQPAAAKGIVEGSNWTPSWRTG